MRNAVLGFCSPLSCFCLTSTTAVTQVTQWTLHKYRLRQDRLAPDSSFYLKMSERLKSNFFSLVPARRLSRPTILDPGPYQP